MNKTLKAYLTKKYPNDLISRENLEKEVLESSLKGVGAKHDSFFTIDEAIEIIERY